jgi:hypothetical protein
LNDKFEPLLIVAAAAVLVVPPFREPSSWVVEPIFGDASYGFEVIVHEAELCRQLIEKVDADFVHLDMSLGSRLVEELSPVQLSNMRISSRARQHLLKVLPRIRKVAADITLKHGAEVLAIGKESVPVRVAELTAGAHAILYASERAVDKGEPILLGLPSRCQPRFAENSVYLYSLLAAEHDVRGFAPDSKTVLGKVNIAELLNPIARGFRTLKITLRKQGGD